MWFLTILWSVHNSKSTCDFRVMVARVGSVNPDTGIENL